MGKTTLHHPVSLPIIREGARQAGIRLGRIHQDKRSADLMTAVYTVEILDFPVETIGATPQKLQAYLNECYSTDIVITRVWYTKSVRIYAELYTTNKAENNNRLVEGWLLTDEEWIDKVTAEAQRLEEENIEGDWLLDYEIRADSLVTRPS